MPPICYLDRLRRSLCRSISVGATTISAHNLNSRMSEQPLAHTLGFPIWQQIKNGVGAQVNDDGAIALSAFPGEVVDAYFPYLSCVRGRKEIERFEERRSPHLDTQMG